MSETKFPHIELDKLILNQPTEDDCLEISQILNHEVYSSNTINIPFPYTEKDAKFWVGLSETGFKNNNHLIFAIREKVNEKIIGAIDLGIDIRFNKAELGFWLEKKYWNKGITTEAAKAMIKFGFCNLKLKRIYASHFDFNGSSGKVLEKAGMTKEGLLKCHTYKNGEYQNHILYSIINE